MPRQIPVPFPQDAFALLSAASQQAAASLEPWTIRCRLVTPMFGGGHTSRENDPITPISSKGIRGQLRYWWRLVAASHLDPTGLNPTELLSMREAELFGSTEWPSPFELSVTTGNANFRDFIEDQPPYGFNATGPEMYGLFPTTQDRKHPVLRLIKEEFEFTLAIRWLDSAVLGRRIAADLKLREVRQRTQFPAAWNLAVLQEQLMAALWAWLNFGGYGSRTRRGVGAVATTNARFAFLDRGCLRHTLPQVSIWCEKATSKDAMEGWARAVDAYRKFRQQRRRSRRPGKSKQTLRFDKRKKEHFAKVITVPNGPSEWPEGDGIRNITGNHLTHKTVTLADGTRFEQQDHSPALEELAFPRAVLGLPINFQFADGPVEQSSAVGITDSERDPDKVELWPQVIDDHGNLGQGQRMTSPVITRPLYIDQQWRPGVICIRASHLDTLSAILTGRPVPAGAASIAANDIQGAKLKRLSVMMGKEDALSAFETFLIKSGRFQKLDTGGQQ